MISVADLLVIVGIIAPLFTFTGIEEISRYLRRVGFSDSFVRLSRTVSCIIGFLCWFNIIFLLFYISDTSASRILVSKLILGVTSGIIGIGLFISILLSEIGPLRNVLLQRTLRTFKNRALKDIDE
jgi:hypothetical protein